VLSSHFAVFLANVMLNEFASNYRQFPTVQNESDTKATGVKNMLITVTMCERNSSDPNSRYTFDSVEVVHSVNLERYLIKKDRTANTIPACTTTGASNA